MAGTARPASVRSVFGIVFLKVITGEPVFYIRGNPFSRLDKQGRLLSAGTRGSWREMKGQFFFLRPVTSCRVSTAPIILPLASRIGDAVKNSHMPEVPSFGKKSVASYAPSTSRDLLILPWYHSGSSSTSLPDRAVILQREKGEIYAKHCRFAEKHGQVGGTWAIQEGTLRWRMAIPRTYPA